MRYHSDKHLSEFYLQDGGKKSTGIGMEQNYVTVTRCINMQRICNQQLVKQNVKIAYSWYIHMR